MTTTSAIDKIRDLELQLAEAKKAAASELQGQEQSLLAQLAAVQLERAKLTGHKRSVGRPRKGTGEHDGITDSIRDVIRANPAATSEDIRVALGDRHGRVRITRTIAQLVYYGYLIPVGEGRQRTYEVKEAHS